MMKMVVTNSTAGMIIGKGGATVKSLNETYDVRIQASQKDDVVMGERVLTILGPEEGEIETLLTTFSFSLWIVFISLALAIGPSCPLDHGQYVENI